MPLSEIVTKAYVSKTSDIVRYTIKKGSRFQPTKNVQNFTGSIKHSHDLKGIMILANLSIIHIILDLKSN